MSKDRILGIFTFIFIITLAFQAVLPKYIEISYLLLKLLLLPLVFIIINRIQYLNIWFLFSFFYILIVLSFSYNYASFYDIQMFTLQIFAMIGYFIFGYNLSISSNKILISNYLLYAVNFINIFILFLYSSVYFGIFSFDFIYDIFEKGYYFDSFTRFSITNSIEFPIAVTSVLYLVIILNKDRNKIYIFSSLLNLFISVISESRIIIIISLLILINELFKLSYKKLLIYIPIILILYFYLTDFLLLIDFDNKYDSVFSRFMGEDSGSTIDRLYIYQLFTENLNNEFIVFGNGIGSSMIFMSKFFNIYRTTESLFIQIIWESGIVGFFLFLSPIMFLVIKRIFNNFKFSDIIILFFLAQSFLFLPLHTNIGLCFVLFGTYSAKNKILDIR